MTPASDSWPVSHARARVFLFPLRPIVGIPKRSLRKCLTRMVGNCHCLSMPTNTATEKGTTMGAATDEDGQFYWMPLDDVNVTDLNSAIVEWPLVGIVDEEQGGIIAYASEDAAERICLALEAMKS